MARARPTPGPQLGWSEGSWDVLNARGGNSRPGSPASPAPAGTNRSAAGDHEHRGSRLGPGRGLLPDLRRSLRPESDGPQAGPARAVDRRPDAPRLQGRRSPRRRRAAGRAGGPRDHRDLPQSDLRGRLEPSLQHLRLRPGRPAARWRRSPPRAARRRPRPRHPGHPRRRLQPRRPRLLAVPACRRVRLRFAVPRLVLSRRRRHRRPARDRPPGSSLPR